MAESTTRQPLATRTQILEAAEAAVLAKGFSATSIDELIAAVGISKSGFFYHFKDKAALAHALLEKIHRNGKRAVRRDRSPVTGTERGSPAWLPG